MSLLDILTGLAGTGAAPNLSGAVPQAPASKGDIEVVGQGDNWSPKHHRGILGFLGDAIVSGLSGTNATPFHDKAERANVHEAMQGFTANPMQAIRRMGMIDGHEKDAWKMRNEEVDNTRYQGTLDRQNSLLDFQKQKYVYSQLSNMMGVAAKRKDPATWQAMREQALNYATQYGVDASSIIPEEFNPDAIDTIALGSVPVAKQMSVAEQVRNHDLQHSDRQEGHSISHERNQIMRDQGGARIGETAQHNDVTEHQGQERIDKTPAKPLRTRYDTKYGRGLVSPDGMEMHITPSDPRIDQSALHSVNGGHKLIYDNLGTADKPIWRLRKK